LLNNTGNHFVETGCLPVIGLRDVMCHMAASPGKESGGCHPMQLHDCILLNSFN